MFSYSTVEGALLDVFDLSEDSRLALRARVRNLQRLGLRPSSPGSGKKVIYTFSDICDLALALNLAEFGVDPKKIVSQLVIGTAASIADDRFCVFTPENFSKGTSELMYVNSSSVSTMATHGKRFAVINIDWMRFCIKAFLRGERNVDS